MDEAFLNDLLECSVCLEQLDSTSKVLPCQHTFCKRCLEEIVNSHKELRCPECRILVDTKVDELPCNILLIRLLEGIKNNPRLHRNSSLTGESCPSRRDPISSGQVLPPPPPPQSPLSSSQRHGTPIGDGRVLPKQILQPLPCAKALYSYDAKEPTDLSFRKGDVIILRKRIDQNWFQGELNGKHGFLPASYLQIMVPLPSHLPQCKALYDFQMGENDEKDCLAFTKGEIITVLRRVDENWAEGKLGERIGIFPISFVEMNTAARAVMKLSANIQLGSSRIVPPTPTIEGIHMANQPVSSVGSSTAPTPSAQEQMSSTTSSPSPASSSTSPSTPGSSSSSTGSLPQSIPVSTPIATVLPIVTSVPSPTQSSPASQSFSRSSSHRSSHQKEKRHSLSAISISQRSPQPSGSHRHSMEILTSDGAVASDSSTILVTTESSPSSSPALTQSAAPIPLMPPSIPHQWQESNGAKVVRRHSNRRERENASTPSSQPSTEQVPMTSSANNALSDSITNGTASTSLSSSSQPSTHVPVPTFYIALYNYKPQKEDELELKKGELYTVSEKCQDGWYKGTSLRTGASGVFPGNYVQVAKSSVPQAQFHQTSSMVASVRPTSSKTSPSSSSHAANIPPRSKPPTSAPTTSTTTISQVSHSSSSSQSQSDTTVQAACANVCSDSGLRPHISTSPSLVSYTRPRPATAQDSRSCIPTGILEWSRSVNALCPPPQRPPRPQGPSNSSTPSTPKSVVSPKQNGTSACGPLRSPSIANWVTNWTASVPLNTNPLAIPEVPTRSVTMTASYPAVSCVISGRVAPSNSVIPCSSSNSTNIAQSWHGSAQPRNSPHSSPLLPQSAMSAVSAVTPTNVSVSVCGVTSVSSVPSMAQQSKSDKHKEKKDKERVSLMKRLTGKRKSKSPPPTNYSCDNPTFVDTPSSINQTSLPVVHMRSGSCPSEALGGQSSHKKTGSLDAGSSETSTKSTSRPKQPAPLVRERFRCIVPYPPNSEYELELQVGDIVYVHKKREDGWYKGTLQRTGKTGLFPASFVESF